MQEIYSLLNQSSTALFVTLLLFGACIGSFINVVVLRLPPMLFSQWKNQCLELLNQQKIDCNGTYDEDTPTLSSPSSRCPNCLRSLRFYHNIPVASYLFLAGKCSYCNVSISIRYPTVEVLAALLSVFLGYIYGPSWHLVLALLFSYILLALSLIDIDHQLLPDNMVLPLLWLGLLANSFDLYVDLKSAVFGAVIGYLILWTIYQIHHRITGKEGMGYGDFKLLAAVGAWLGWQMLPIVILLASIGGTLIALVFMISRKQSKDVPISFGPYLALSAWVVMIWGDKILQNYLQVFNL